MTRNLLEKEGAFLGESDFDSNGLYAGTRKFYAYGDDVYTAETHTNAFTYTGKNDTYKIADKETVKTYNHHYFADNFKMDEETYKNTVKHFA